MVCDLSLENLEDALGGDVRVPGQQPLDTAAVRIQLRWAARPSRRRERRVHLSPSCPVLQDELQAALWRECGDEVEAHWMAIEPSRPIYGSLGECNRPSKKR